MCVTVGVMDIDVITDGVGELLRYIKIFRKIDTNIYLGATKFFWLLNISRTKESHLCLIS
jgi:hypothetical protein